MRRDEHLVELHQLFGEQLPESKFEMRKYDDILENQQVGQIQNTNRIP